MESANPQSNDTVSQNDSSKRRRPTEKRKLQNRIAQKKYRENLKSRLENLERQAAEIQEQQNTSPDTASHLQVVDSLAPQVTEEPAPILDENVFDFLLDMDPIGATGQVLPVATDTESFSFPTFSDTDNIFNATLPTVSSSSSNLQDTTTPMDPLSLDVEFQYDMYLNQMTSDNPQKDPLNQFSIQDAVNWAPWVPNRAWANGRSPVKAIDNFVRLQPDANTVTKITMRPAEKPDDIIKFGTTFSRSLVQQLRLDDSNENKSLVQTAIARGHNIRDVFLAGLGALDKRETMRPRMGFDPYKNTLTLVPTSTLQAYLSNAMAIRLPMKGLKNEEFQSPYFQPEALASGNMAPLEAIWSDFPKALQPSRGQITIPHHPWMDMIPFPTIRDRALTLSTLDPPIIDINDFKNDVFLNSGLFCWRVGGPSGSGQPWDMRSWEAEPWFLKKWWILVGGESGDVWEQTHWWRNMRGVPKIELDGAAK